MPQHDLATAALCVSIGLVLSGLIWGGKIDDEHALASQAGLTPRFHVSVILRV